MLKRRVNLSLILVNLYILQLSFIISAIRKDISIQQKICRTTVQGRYLLSDDNVANYKPMDDQTLFAISAFLITSVLNCGSCMRCTVSGSTVALLPWERRAILFECNLVSQCCHTYEFCVSCCLNPARTQKELALKVKIAKPMTAGTYSSIFDFCAGRCRHNSESVVHENSYHSDFHHCFSLPSNSSGAADKRLELRLAGINIVIGKQGESCDSVCKSRGQSCVPNKLTMLNQCEMMQKYMSCKGACLVSIGADQPAEVVDDAPRHLNPGACLYTRTQSILSCDGSHRHTRRLCPCA